MKGTYQGKEPWQLGASESAALMRAGRLSCIDLLESILDRMHSCNGAVNAVVAQYDREPLLDQARAVERRFSANQPHGLLDGLPLTIKDNLWVKGLPATWGLEALSTFIPGHDEPVVSCVRAAGAIVLGKTNVPPMCLAPTTNNDVYGLTRNPIDLALTPGGSSGGAAAAVASGIGVVALATDAGGSIRRPAAYTNTVGFKPSSGAVLGTAGFPRTSFDFQVVGPIARNVEDCALLFSVIASGARRFSQWRKTLRPEEWLRSAAYERRARVLAIEAPARGQDSLVTSAFSECAERLARAGHQVVWRSAPYSVEEVEDFWAALLPQGIRSAIEDLGLAADELPMALRNIESRASAHTAADMYRMVTRLYEWRQRMSALWAEVDVVLSPTSPCGPWSHEDSYPTRIGGLDVSPRAGALYAVFANAIGAPSISIPIPDRPGIGLQLTGAPASDTQLLAWAWECEQCLV